MFKRNVEQIDLWRSGSDGYHTYRIPALVVTKDNSILVFCEGRKHQRGDTGDIALLVKRSTDGGATWSSQSVVWDDPWQHQRQSRAGRRPSQRRSPLADDLEPRR